MLLQSWALDVTMSWDDGFLGARASRPHNAWHSLGHLPHLDQPGTAPWLSFGLAATVTADVVAASKAARKLSNHHTDQDAGGTPALPGGTPPLRGSRRRWLMRWGGQLTAGPPLFIQHMHTGVGILLSREFVRCMRPSFPPTGSTAGLGSGIKGLRTQVLIGTGYWL